MAIDPSTEYPGQIDADVNYPFGKARNVAVSGDGTGTPWEKALVNDLFGFQQALLDTIGATPTGTPDSIAASQYLEAVRILPHIGRHDVPLVAAANFDDRFSGESDFCMYTQVDITDTGELDFNIAVPKIGTALKIDEIHAIVSGTSVAVGAHAALPATVPAIALVRRTITPGGTIAAHTVVASATDPSANFTDYNKIHLISATGIAHTIADRGYTLSFTGEAGANAEADKLVLLALYFVLIP